MLAIEKDRAAAIELGRHEGALEWADTVEDLARACRMRPSTERHLELERLSPFVARARAEALDRSRASPRGRQRRGD
jgi:hypothetical protein